MSLQTKKLNEVADFIRGITFSPNDIVEDFTENIVGVMRTKNVQKVLDLSDVWKINRKLVSHEKQFLEEGDLLISSANSWNLVGKASWVHALKFPCSFGGFVTVLRGDKKKINRRYLYHWFVSKKIQTLLRSFSNKTTNISNLSLKRTGELNIPFPSLVVQQYNSTLLDTVNNILRLHKLSITKLDELAESIFLQINKSAINKFKLNEIGKIIGGATPKSKKKEYWNGKICWVTPAELNKLDDIFINTTLRKITDNGLKNCSASLLPANSVLFSSRAPIGHIAINTVPMATNQGFKSFIVDKTIVEPIYLYYWLNCNRKFLQSMGVGATFKELSKNLISSIKIDLPTLSEQRTFVKKIHFLHKIKVDKKNIISKHLKLISSLQHLLIETE